MHRQGLLEDAHISVGQFFRLTLTATSLLPQAAERHSPHLHLVTTTTITFSGQAGRQAVSSGFGGAKGGHRGTDAPVLGCPAAMSFFVTQPGAASGLCSRYEVAQQYDAFVCVLRICAAYYIADLLEGEEREGNTGGSAELSGSALGWHLMEVTVKWEHVFFCCPFF